MNDCFPPLVLASGSPRRSELLRQVSIPFRVHVPEVDELSIRHASPVRLARELAVAKALTAAMELAAARESSTGEDEGADRPADPDEWILAADTVVAIGLRILEKPADRAEAFAMISRLAGRTHRVITGVALLVPGRPRGPITAPARFLCVRHRITRVTFNRLSAAEIEWYLDRDEWHDVAGAYRVQGAAARYIRRIRGSYSNVVGLPLELVYSILTGHNRPVSGRDTPSSRP